MPTGPGKTALGPGELITAISLPPRGAAGGDAYQRFIPRTEMDIAVVGCAVNLTVEDDTITHARVVLGAVAPTVLLVPEAAALVGTTLDVDALAALAEAARAAAKPITDKRGTAVHDAGNLKNTCAAIISIKHRFRSLFFGFTFSFILETRITTRRTATSTQRHELWTRTLFSL